jgi:hypothetical protein
VYVTTLAVNSLSLSHAEQEMHARIGLLGLYRLLERAETISSVERTQPILGRI